MAKQQVTKPAKSQGDKKRSLLKKRISLPGKGKMAHNVPAPKWAKSIGRYFAGAWHELREVSWPTRRATWGLTMAVIIFTAAMMILILTLDFGFEQLFKWILF